MPRDRDHGVRVDAHDPHNYDLVLDSQSLGLPIVAEILVRTIEAGRVPKIARDEELTSAYSD